MVSLRPIPSDGIPPYKKNDIVGLKLIKDIKQDDYLTFKHLKMIKGKLTTLRAVEYNDLDKLKFWRNNPDFRKNFREHKELNSVNQNLWFEKYQIAKTITCSQLLRITQIN